MTGDVFILVLIAMFGLGVFICLAAMIFILRELSRDRRIVGWLIDRETSDMDTYEENLRTRARSMDDEAVKEEINALRRVSKDNKEAGLGHKIIDDHIDILVDEMGKRAGEG